MARSGLAAVVLGLLGSLLGASRAVAAEEAYPAFSPDGSRIAFSSDEAGSHDLYVHSLVDGTRRRLTERTGTETQPSWSPDGRELVYVRRAWNPFSRSVLMRMDAAGGEPERVGDVLDVAAPDWHTDGRIYFSMRREGAYDVMSVLPDGSDLRAHTETPGIDEGNVSVRETTLAYDRPEGESSVIEFLDLRNGSKRVLVSGSVHWDPEWLPDGSLLVGVYATAGSPLSVLHRFGADGEALGALTPADRNVFWPTASPDGRTVVFSYSSEDFGVGTLHRLDLDSGSLGPLP